MPDYTLRTWIARRIQVRQRLKRVCTGYLLFLMVVTTKHTLEEAARFSRLHKSQFSKLLKCHPNIAAQTLESLSKQQAKRLSISLEAVKGLPWKIVIIIDSTLQSRSSLHPENSKKFNHGQGFVIGHQWTNVVLSLNGTLIPLRPIPFYTQRYCREHDQAYLTEHERVVNYLSNLNLDDYIGPHRSRDVVVLTDSGYDNKKIENAIVDKRWAFITALSKTRSVKSETLYHSTPKSKQWLSVELFFRHHRRLKWSTIRLMTNGTKAKRKEFRIRHTMGYLRYVGWVHLVCSEPKKRSEGRRRYLACNDVRVTARQIMLGYRLRWAVELFHKQIKQFLGFEDVSSSGFDSIKSHIYWVYCAYLLLHMSPPGGENEMGSLGDQQRRLRKYLDHKEKRSILQKLTQIGGVQRYKDELRQALVDI
jgi:Transposase DDE domain